VKNLKFVSLALILLGSVASFAQAPKAEVSVDYSLLVYNPAKNLSGSRNLNGGGGSFVYNFGKYIGVKGEFQGYGSTTATFHLTNGTFNTQANMFTYLFGPQVSIPTKRVRIFGETLFGGAYTNGYANLFKAAGLTSLGTDNNGFAMAFGGGVDIPAGRHIAFRVAEVDYLLTRYEWKSIGINNQSNFRYQAGVVFAFGGD
jgi:hypothetical protein